MNNSESFEPNDVTQYDRSSTDSTQKKSNSSRMQPGMELGDFRLLRRLGRGGMAEVWLAEQMSLKRNVALKLLRPDMMEDETYVARFQTEAKAAAGLNHPNIVQVYTVGCDDGQHFIAQEYVHGNTLKDLIKKRGPLDLQRALSIMKQVTSAMQAASERGIVHRDIKPENIMLTKKGEAKVADFGLAQLQGGERLNLTQEGVTMGTPLYMSPEQVSGKKLDQRSDIYSLGVTFYHMLSGTPPYQGENAVSVAVQHLHNDPEPIGNIRADLPNAICRMIERMMAKAPEDRYQTSGALMNDVRRIIKAVKTGETADLEEAPLFPVARPVLTLISLCLLVMLVSAGIGYATRPKIPQADPNAIDPSIPVMNTAREQYLYAMFEVDNEDAFQLVIRNFKDPKDRVWVQRAHEQLALLYLKDKARARDAKKQLDELASFPDPRLKAESRIGEAYLLQRDDEIAGADRAEKILQSDGEEFEKYLTGSWKELEFDVRRLVSEKKGRGGPPAPPAGQGPPPQPPQQS